MKISNVFVTQEQKDFLERIIHEDAANSIGGEKGEMGNAVQWCIDACMKIEQRYGVDACYVAHNDIRVDISEDVKKLEDEHNDFLPEPNMTYPKTINPNFNQ